jgi:ATP-dependent protease ClpP protease subunit
MAKKRTGKSQEPPPEVAIIGELFEEGETDIVKSLLDIPPGEEATLYIDSAGGSVYAALTISSLIRLRKLRATAIVLGECSSSALLIFAACSKRFVTPRSIFLFHRVKWRSEKDVRSEEAANWASHFKWLETEVDRYQAELFGVAEKQFAEWIHEGRFVVGADLVELGVAEMLDV